MIRTFPNSGASSVWHAGSSCFSIAHVLSETSASRRGTGSKRCVETVLASTAFESTISGACASAGRGAMPSTRRSRTITREALRKGTRREEPVKKTLDPIHPGEILLEEFMKPLGVSQNQLARDLDVPVARVNDIVHGRRVVTADTALRLGKYFGTSPELWLGLQVEYDLRRAKRETWPKIERRVRSIRAA